MVANLAPAKAPDYVKVANFPCLYRHSRSGRYYACKKVSGRRKEHSLETCDRKIAERRLKEWIGNLEKVDAEVEKTTIDTLMHRYVAVTAGLSESSKATDRSIIKRFWAWWPHGRDFQVRQVRPSMLDTWLAHEAPRLRNVSYNGYASFIRQLFDIAVGDRIIAESPAKSLRVFWKKPQTPVRIVPTEAQFQAIIDDIRALPLTVLFKLFNRVETWELLQREAGPPHTSSFNVERYDRVLTAAMNRGERVYSAAYIMPSGGSGSPFARKHRMHLDLLARMLRDELPERLAGMKTMAEAFAALRAYPTIGDFLAYQYVTDLNYSILTGFSETEFVVPGPGALSGLRKCFADTGKLTDSEVIRLLQERQQECFAAVRVTFPSLPGRELQFIDVQNLFCEVDKYARVAYPQFTTADSRQRIKQRFQPSATTPPLWYPPKWGINEKLGVMLSEDAR